MVYWAPEKIYFLTTSTFLHYPYFKFDEHKQLILDQMKKAQKNLNLDYYSYSIAKNHYHLVSRSGSSESHTKTKQIINGGTAFEYGRQYPHLCKKKYFWGDTKSLKILSREMYWKVIGYVAGNLLKHREVKNFKELRECRFSSYKAIAEKYGDEAAEELVLAVIDVPEVQGVPAWEEILEYKLPSDLEGHLKTATLL